MIQKFGMVLILLTMGMSTYAQQFEAGMQKALGLWQEGKIQEASALFERIGSAKGLDCTQAWLPLYYGANVMISSSYAEADKEKRALMLQKAESLIEEADKRSPYNAEIITLKGLLYTSYVAMDPATYAMEYSPKVMTQYQMAIQIDPKNPRAQSNNIEYQMNTAKYFGKDVAEFCERMKAILPLFDTQAQDYPFAPSWGKERATKISASCDSKQ